MNDCIDHEIEAGGEGIEFSIFEIAQARRKPPTKQGEQPKDMVARTAPHVLDGLFDHESKLDIDEHYTTPALRSRSG